MHYPLVHHQYRAVWPIAFRSKRLYHSIISVINISLLRHVLRADIQRQREQTPQEKRNRQLWNVAHQENDTNWDMVALSMLRWSIYLCFRYFFLRFSYSLMQFPPSILKLSTQHPPYFFKLSTQHQAAITRFENRVILPTQGLQFSYTLIRAFSKISAYTKTVQFYSTENTSMNKFLAQSSSPCLMLGGIPPASLSEGWT